MQDMVDFFTIWLGLIADFLMTEPMKYFVGIIIGLWVVALIHKIFKV